MLLEHKEALVGGLGSGKAEETSEVVLVEERDGQSWPCGLALQSFTAVGNKSCSAPVEEVGLSRSLATAEPSPVSILMDRKCGLMWFGTVPKITECHSDGKPGELGSAGFWFHSSTCDSNQGSPGNESKPHVPRCVLYGRWRGLP